MAEMGFCRHRGSMLAPAVVFALLAAIGCSGTTEIVDALLPP
jgi:hypothetical protein